MKLGQFIKQPPGYKAFVPAPFPPKEGFSFSSELLQKASEATLYLGKLDGITLLLPNLDFFLYMYICKDAASSSQIEGTHATMIDAMEAISKTSENLPDDVDDILHYIQALNYGLKRLKDLPLSLRLIKEIHSELMKDARSSHFADPGSFRQSQNWIGGTTLNNALFIPPPVHEMSRALGELENFFHDKDSILPIIKAGIIHAHFETIHPFLDGNGRTGRMLITLFLCIEKLLDNPVLFLSSYFKKHQQLYYKLINGYHHGEIENWLKFFLDGVTNTAKEAIKTIKEITILREEDMKKIQSLGKTAAKNAVEIMPKLFQQPVVNVSIIQEWTKFSRAGSQKTIDRFIDLKILELKDENTNYRRTFIYRRYVDIFTE